jgi:hypothetical protein
MMEKKSWYLLQAMSAHSAHQEYSCVASEVSALTPKA